MNPLEDKLTFVGLTSKGHSIYRAKNEVGGDRYWSDEVGGGVIVWDTCLVDLETLEAVIALEKYKKEIK